MITKFGKYKFSIQNFKNNLQIPINNNYENPVWVGVKNYKYIIWFLLYSNWGDYISSIYKMSYKSIMFSYETRIDILHSAYNEDYDYEIGGWKGTECFVINKELYFIIIGFNILSNSFRIYFTRQLRLEYNEQHIFKNEKDFLQYSLLLI